MSNVKRITLTFHPNGLSPMQQELVPLLLKEGKIAERLLLLEEEQQAEFAKMLNEAIDEVNREHLRLMDLLGQTMRMPVKQLAWENNHLKISKTIERGLAQTGRIPSQTQIAASTGLSRKAVYDHMAQGGDNSVFTEHLQQYTMMAPRVMDSVLSGAILKSDTKAARLYFDILEKMKDPNAPAIYNTQNNYIQINNTVIKQEAISHLNPEQLKQIEEMVWKTLQEGKIEEGSEVETGKPEV